MAPEPQTIGRYEIVDRVGRGGMGVVFRARDPRIGRQVAIKLLSVPDESLRDRFLQEAQSVGNLTHRNIVTIFDFGEHDDQPYIVMEFVEGVTLADQIHDSVPMALWRKLEIMEELSTGLDYAHNKGIVHRDIKPANVMTDRDGVVKILDFGIARVGNVTMTQAGMMLGTPNYMSPEQFESGRIDRRSDIFSVGVLFYELLTYRKAFTGEQVWDVMKAVMTKKPEPVGELVPGIDPAVEAAILRAIEKDPAKRYQTLAEMIADVAKARGRLGVRLASEDSVTVLTPPPGAAPRTPRPFTDRDLISKRRAERIEEYLKEAQRAFDAGEFGTAVDACDQAILLDPDDARVHGLLERARRALDRQQALDLIADARAHLERDDLEQAAALVDQATQFDPAFADAREAKSAIDERIRQRDAEHRKRKLELDAALALIDQQKEMFAAGHWHEAIGALERHTPRLDVVAAAIADMRTELVEIDRRIREEEEQQKREQAEAQRRWVARQLDLARRAIAGQQFADAIEILEHVQRNSPDPPGLIELLREAQQGQSAADEAARRKEQIAGILSRAADEVGRGKLIEARSLVASALTIEPAHPDALARLRDIKTAIEAEDRAKREQEAAAAEARAKQEREAATAQAKHEREAAAARAKQEREAAAARARQEREAAKVATPSSAKSTTIQPAPPIDVQQVVEAAKPRVPVTPAPELPVVSPQVAGELPGHVPAVHPSASPAPVAEKFTAALSQLPPRTLAVAGAALVVILAIVYFGFFRGPSPDTNTAGPARTAPAPTAATSSPTPAPPAATPPPAAAPAAPPAASPDQQIAELRDRARQQFGRGDWQNGIVTANAGLTLRKDDRELQTILIEALTSARSRLIAERDAATALGRFAVGTNAFNSAVRRQRTVEQLQRSGQMGSAIRTAWETVDLFKQAQTEGRRLAQADANAAKTPSGGIAPPSPAAPIGPPSPSASPSTPQPSPSAQPPPAPSPPPLAPVPPPAAAEPAPSARPAPQPTQPQPLPPPVSSPASDQRDIRAVLQAYADAYSRLDPAAVKRVYPGINEQALRANFSSMKSQQVAIVNEQFVNLTDSTATVTCTWSAAFVGSAGGTQRQSPRITIRLQKTNGAWIIVDRR